MKMKFDLKGTEKLLRKFEFERIKPNIIDAMDKTMNYCKKEYIKDAPKKSGKLVKSVKAGKTSVTAKKVTGKVTVGKFYGRFLENGTKEHLIPKKKTKKKAIKFDGVIVKYAMHPGIRARKIMEKALDKTIKKLPEFFSRNIIKFFTK